MRTKIYLRALLIALVTIFGLTACMNEDEPKDITKEVTMYVSSKTGIMYNLFDSEREFPIECMLVKEQREDEYHPLAFSGIQGFEYEKGYEYDLRVNKTTLANPPADGNIYKYQLVRVIEKRLVELLPQAPKDTVQGTFSPQWTALIDNSRDENNFVIDTKYLGIQGSACLATAPYLYVGATFPASTFATSFDKEIADEKQSIDLIFDFPNPYITCMEVPKGNEYLKKIKDAIRSEEYQTYTFPKRPYIVKFAELESLSNIKSCFPDNQDFGNTLEKIGLQKFDMEHIKSLCIGKIVFKGFTISMDIPSKSIFINEPFSSEDLVYIRSLTYGTTAYFIIVSEKSYQDVLSAFKSSFMDDYNNLKGTLHKSQILLLTISDINQEAEVKVTFNDLNNFLKDPFMSGKTYGYPIYCKGFYVKNNEIFTRAN